MFLTGSTAGLQALERSKGRVCVECGGLKCHPCPLWPHLSTWPLGGSALALHSPPCALEMAAALPAKTSWHNKAPRQKRSVCSPCLLLKARNNLFERSQRTSLSLFPFMHWRRKWQPTPVFLPGESQGRGSLVGCRLWGHTESDTTEVT